MVAVAFHHVVHVRDEGASLVVPAALKVEQLEVPEDALRVLGERGVPLAVGQRQVGPQRPGPVQLDQHHRRVDQDLRPGGVGVLAGVEAGVGAGGQDVAQGGEGDGSDEGVGEVGVLEIDDQARVDVGHEGVAELGSVQQDAGRGDGEVPAQELGDGLHGAQEQGAGVEGSVGVQICPRFDGVVANDHIHRVKDALQREAVG